MTGTYLIHGHAIVSANDRIADADGRVPPALRNETDWVRFQAALDRAAVTVLGRHGHEANPNPRRRNRLVLSSSLKSIERRDDAWWWNPEAAPLEEALAAAAPSGGIVAGVGGRRVFDLFLAAGFDRFDLARIAGVNIADGVPLFSAVLAGRSAEATLAAAGMTPGPRELLDPAAEVTLVTWTRAR